MIICLDLAVSIENQTLDKVILLSKENEFKQRFNNSFGNGQDLSLKLAGLKKPAYNANKQTIKQVLGLNQDLTIKDICVQLGCPEIGIDAENLYSK